MMPDKDLSDDVLDEIIAGAKTSMEQYLALSLKAERADMQGKADQAPVKQPSSNEPVSETYNLPELIEGMEVSIDVSTCDADAGNRYFGTVTEVSELYTARNGYILLVQDAKPNFDVNGNTPVIPDGYTLVPVEPTDEMIAAAMNCEDVLFNSDESFCVQFGNIYEAMLAAAQKKETGPCTK